MHSVALYVHILIGDCWHNYCTYLNVDGSGDFRAVYAWLFNVSGHQFEGVTLFVFRTYVNIDLLDYRSWVSVLQRCLCSEFKADYVGLKIKAVYMKRKIYFIK